MTILALDKSAHPTLHRQESQIVPISEFSHSLGQNRSLNEHIRTTLDNVRIAQQLNSFI
jgi:hypothetical protein